LPNKFSDFTNVSEIRKFNTEEQKITAVWRELGTKEGEMAEEERAGLRHRYHQQGQRGSSSRPGQQRPNATLYGYDGRRSDDFPRYGDYEDAGGFYEDEDNYYADEDDYRAAAFHEIVDRNGALPPQQIYLAIYFLFYNLIH
jgi:hypothetical protein